MCSGVSRVSGGRKRNQESLVKDLGRMGYEGLSAQSGVEVGGRIKRSKQDAGQVLNILFQP